MLKMNSVCGSGSVVLYLSLSPGSKKEKKSASGIWNKHPRSYFQELFVFKKAKFFVVDPDLMSF
jgi:hypothetical protein